MKAKMEGTNSLRNKTSFAMWKVRAGLVAVVAIVLGAYLLSARAWQPVASGQMLLPSPISKTPARDAIFDSKANLNDRTTQMLERFDELIAKARQQGTVPLVVGFRFAFTPEGYLTDSSRVNQRAGIKQNQDALLEKLKIFRPENIKRYQTTPYLALTVDAKTIEFLKTLPEVVFIREDELQVATLSESTQVVHAPQAWNAGYSGQGQVVAILDTGVDKNHAFLSGKVVSEACYSTTSASQGTSSVCPGGVAQSTATNSGLPCTFGSVCYHGTHVAGISAGRFASGSLQGVARDASLVAIQVFSRVNANNGANTFSSDYRLGLQRVLLLKQGGMNIASVNMSLGSVNAYTSNCDSQFLDVKADIDNLRSVGVATVIASGNGDANGNGYINAISSPACISSAVSVGSTGDGSLGATLILCQLFQTAPLS